jgi:hypothetical protein
MLVVNIILANKLEFKRGKLMIRKAKLYCRKQLINLPYERDISKSKIYTSRSYCWSYSIQVPADKFVLHTCKLDS